MQITNYLGTITVDKAVYLALTKAAASKVEGIRFIDSMFSMFLDNRVKVENQNERPNITVEVEVDYGLNLPTKGREIQRAVHDILTEFLTIGLADINVYFRKVAVGA